MLDKGPWLQMYMVPGNYTPLGWQTTEGSPTWQAGGGSFLLLPRRHALSSGWLWTFNHNMCENHLEVQGAASISLFPPLLFQEYSMYSSCVRSARLHASDCETWPLRKPNLLCLQRQGNDQTDLQCQAAKHCHHQIQWSTSTAWHWAPGHHSEGEKAPLVWTLGTLQWCSRQPLTYRLMESMGLGGPRWHGSSWQRVEALIYWPSDIPGDLMWNLPCKQQASYLEGGPLMLMLPQYLEEVQGIQKSDDDDESMGYNSKHIYVQFQNDLIKLYIWCQRLAMYKFQQSQWAIKYRSWSVDRVEVLQPSQPMDLNHVDHSQFT